MKLLAVAIVAAISFAVTAAAPTAYHEEHDDPANKTIIPRLICTMEVAKNLTSDNELAEIWEVYEPIFQEHLINLTNCLGAENEAEEESCFHRERHELRRTYRSFVHDMHVINETAASEIDELVHTMCRNATLPEEKPTEETPTEAPELTQTNSSFNWIQETSSNGSQYWSDLLSCAIVVGQNVTQENNLTTVWELYESKLLDHLLNLTECDNAGNDTEVDQCLWDVIREANQTYTEFVDAVDEVNPETASEIVRIVRTECIAKEPTEEPATEAPPTLSYDIDYELETLNSTTNWTEALICAIEVGSNVTEANNLTDIWEVYEPLLYIHLVNLTDCETADDDTEVKKCVNATAKAAADTYLTFVRDVSAVNQTAAAEIIHLLRTVCQLNPPTEAPPTEAPPTLSFDIDYELEALNSTTNWTEALICAIEVGSNVTEAKNLTAIWEDYEPLLYIYLGNLTDCESAGDGLEVEECVNTTAKAASEIYLTFVRDVSAVDEEAAAEIIHLLRTVCQLDPPTEAPPTETPPTFYSEHVHMNRIEGLRSSVV